eukprot:scaffold2857_cov121-Isochrysis_galbana.AAC.7
MRVRPAFCYCWCLCRRVYRPSRGALGTARTEAEGLARAQAPPGADAWAKRRANHAADAHNGVAQRGVQQQTIAYRHLSCDAR